MAVSNYLLVSKCHLNEMLYYYNIGHKRFE